MANIFSIIFYIPLYNALIFCINFLSFHNAGLAVIVLTIIIRIILFPLSRQAIKTQLQMKLVEPELKKIRETVKDKQEQAKRIMQVYKESDINPFASIILLIIQLPILIALYQVFRSSLPKVTTSILYPFITAPSIVYMSFLGISLSSGSVILAIITVITQFIQLQLSLPKVEKSKERSFQNDLAYNMNVQMKYIFPLIIFPIAYISSVLALYLITTNIFMILQELFVRRRLAEKYNKAV